jgi:hypothetical protein
MKERYEQKVMEQGDKEEPASSQTRVGPTRIWFETQDDKDTPRFARLSSKEMPPKSNQQQFFNQLE